MDIGRCDWNNRAQENKAVQTCPEDRWTSMAKEGARMGPC